MNPTVTPADLRTLRKSLQAAGVFERDELATWLELAALLTVCAALVALHTQLPLWANALLLPVTGFFMASLAMIGHDAGHRALSKSGWRCELMYHLAFTVLGGLGALQWKDKHNVRHHGHPNVIGVDDDMEVWPLAHIRAEYERSGPVRRWVQRNLQGYLWWPMTMLFTWSMKVDTTAMMIRYARERGIDRAWLVDLTCQIAHYVLWLVIPSLVWGFWPVFAFYVAIFAIVSLALALVFSTGHMGLPIVHDHADGWTLQLETTRNLILPRWLSFFFMGLDYQIEHHLFPKIPHRRLRHAAPIVQAWAEERGLPYHRVPYFQALAAVTRYVHHAWRYDPVPPGRAPAPREPGAVTVDLGSPVDVPAV